MGPPRLHAPARVQPDTETTEPSREHNGCSSAQPFTGEDSVPALGGYAIEGVGSDLG